jgi:hypothetical protein
MRLDANVSYRAGRKAVIRAKIAKRQLWARKQTVSTWLVTREADIMDHLDSP